MIWRFVGRVGSVQGVGDDELEHLGTMKVVIVDRLQPRLRWGWAAFPTPQTYR